MTIATALRKLDIGEITQNLKSVSEIPKGHKIALKNISKGEKIIGHDQLIGIARKEILRDSMFTLIILILNQRIMSMNFRHQ